MPCSWGRESVRTVVGNILFYSCYFCAVGWDAKNSRVKLEDDGDHLERFVRAIGAKPSPAITPIIDRNLANTALERKEQNQLVGRKGRTPFVLTPIAFWNNKKLRGQHHRTGRFYSTYGSGPWINADKVETDGDWSSL